MENADHTPRRHIGYHKGSKTQLISHDRSSSCPMYSSPPKNKQKNDKQKVDILTQIDNTIHCLNNPSDIPDKDSFVALNQTKKNSLIRENCLLKKENDKLKFDLTAYNNSEECENDTRHSQDPSHIFYHNIYVDLERDRRNLLKILNDYKKRERYDAEILDIRRIYPIKRIDFVMSQLKRNMDKFNSYYWNSDNTQDNEYEDDLIDNEYSLSNKNYYYEEQNYNTFIKPCFEEKYNITNESTEENKENIVLTTEKYDESYEQQRENTNEIAVISLKQFEKSNIKQKGNQVMNINNLNNPNNSKKNTPSKKHNQNNNPIKVKPKFPMRETNKPRYINH